MPHPLSRNLHDLTTRTFDLLVIGGGIYGLTIAADAAQRGLSVALVERADFGSGTSFNHLRTIHGGLRYLQTLDLPRARESVRERRTLARIAPWAVQPLPFVLPLYRSLAKGKTAMRCGFALDRLVAHDRNDGVPATLALPAGRVLGRTEAQLAYPDLRPLDITGAAVWYDYVTGEADRLTLAWALAAAAHGAVLANYAEATSLRVEAGRVGGATVIDQFDGSAHHTAARTVVNATGGGIDRLLEPLGAAVALPVLQAVNLVTTRPGPSAAIGGRSLSGRNLFLVPWRGRALFGTWESPSTCAPGDLAIAPAHLEAFIAELNQAFPLWHLTPGDVALVHRGTVPAQLRGGRPPTLDGGERVYEHQASGVTGLLSVAGTKYTTARAVAERIVNRLFDWLERPRVASATAITPLPHVPLDGDALLRHAATHEMVCTLADAVMRRTTLGALGCPDPLALEAAATVVGDALEWTADRRREEIAGVRSLY